MPYEDSGLTHRLKPVVKAEEADRWLFVNVVRNPAQSAPLQGRVLESALRPVGFQALSKRSKVYVLPSCDEVFPRIRTSLAFGQEAELGVSAKNKWVHCGAIAGRPVLKMYF
jgi:hypothetical protein